MPTPATRDRGRSAERARGCIRGTTSGWEVLELALVPNASAGTAGFLACLGDKATAVGNVSEPTDRPVACAQLLPPSAALRPPVGAACKPKRFSRSAGPADVALRTFRPPAGASSTAAEDPRGVATSNAGVASTFGREENKVRTATCGLVSSTAKPPLASRTSSRAEDGCCVSGSSTAYGVSAQGLADVRVLLCRPELSLCNSWSPATSGCSPSPNPAELGPPPAPLPRRPVSGARGEDVPPPLLPQPPLPSLGCAGSDDAGADTMREGMSASVPKGERGPV
mmetsp:Transcript_23469/g.79548  ORF Transcript_23469/g.79548 Transcript_23469/m.79548 type:complete len:282 (-) Transcript_23469:1126-1971(-)